MFLGEEVELIIQEKFLCWFKGSFDLANSLRRSCQLEVYFAVVMHEVRVLSLVC